MSQIQAAHVGVGISGQEGMQAVMAADFAIAQFRFLANLLLIHGRSNYKRIARIVGCAHFKRSPCFEQRHCVLAALEQQAPIVEPIPFE